MILVRFSTGFKRPYRKYCMNFQKFFRRMPAHERIPERNCHQCSGYVQDAKNIGEPCSIRIQMAEFRPEPDTVVQNNSLIDENSPGKKQEQIQNPPILLQNPGE